MDSVIFEKIAADLRTLASRIPLNWGAVQNNLYDHLVDMFGCETFESLEKAISGFGDTIKQYFRRIWYMWKCAQCDEHLFCENPNSFVAQEREFYLRCAWGIKRTAYHDFCGTIASVKTYNYNGCEAAVLFVLERERGKAEYCIPRKG